MGYENPILRLKAAKKLLAMPADVRAPLEAVLRELRAQADVEAENSWRRRKGPMASYWRAVSTYARHFAHSLSKGTGKSTGEGIDTGLTYGYELRVRDEAPVDIWFDNEAARAAAIEGLAYNMRLKAENVEIRAVHIVRLPDGSIHQERGPAALHEMWRPTVFRASHITNPAYMDQAAVVDLISGRVLIADKEDPFKPSQQATYCEARCLEENDVSDRHAQWPAPQRYSPWPAVRPAAPGEDAHYVVADEAGLARLRSQTRCTSHRLSRLKLTGASTKTSAPATSVARRKAPKKEATA